MRRQRRCPRTCCCRGRASPRSAACWSSASPSRRCNPSTRIARATGCSPRRGAADVTDSLNEAGLKRVFGVSSFLLEPSLLQIGARLRWQGRGKACVYGVAGVLTWTSVDQSVSSVQSVSQSVQCLWAHVMNTLCERCAKQCDWEPLFRSEGGGWPQCKRHPKVPFRSQFNIIKSSLFPFPVCCMCPMREYPRTLRCPARHDARKFTSLSLVLVFTKNCISLRLASLGCVHIASRSSRSSAGGYNPACRCRVPRHTTHTDHQRWMAQPRQPPRITSPCKLSLPTLYP